MKKRKNMALKILFIIGCIAAYSLILYVIVPYIVDNQSFGGDAAGAGMAQGYALLIYSIAFCILFFIISFFLSHYILGSVWWALLFVVLGLSIANYPKYRSQNRRYIEKMYYENGELLMTNEMKGGSMDGCQTVYRRDGSIDYIMTWHDSKRLGLYQSFYDNGQIMIDGNYDKNQKLNAKYYSRDGTELKKSDGSAISEKEFWDWYRGDGEKGTINNFDENDKQK